MEILAALVALIGLSALVLGTIALAKGSFKSLHIKDRKAAGVVTGLGFVWFVVAGSSLPSDSGTQGPVTSESLEAPTSESSEIASVPLSIAVPRIEIVDVETAEISGTSEPGATVMASWNSGSGTATTDPTGTFRIRVGPITGQGETQVNISARFPGKRTGTSTATVVRTVSESKFKSLAATISYDELKKDPDALAGTAVTYRAKIFQYDARTTTSGMLVSVTNEGYGLWTDNVALLLDPEVGSGADEEDLIQFWGTVTGALTYETAIGGSNTIPQVLVRYLTVVRKE